MQTDAHRESRSLHKRALEHLPAGVNSPSRVNLPGPYPDTLFLQYGRGSQVVDVDSNVYVDLHMCSGALLLGHGDKGVEKAAWGAIKAGGCFAASHPLEARVAAKLKHFLPSIDLVRFLASGSEAVQAALGVARVATGRQGVVVFDGCYHGWLNLGNDVTILPINDASSLLKHMRERWRSTAAVMIEPQPAAAGLVKISSSFLAEVKQYCKNHGSLLIFDEIITGLRHPSFSAQNDIGIYPDLTVLGKAIAGGFPIGILAGPSAVMEPLASGAYYQGGTFSAHPVSLHVADYVLSRIDAAAHSALEALGRALEAALHRAIRDAGANCSLLRKGSMISIYSGTTSPKTAKESRARQLEPWAAIYGTLLRRGLFVPPRASKPWFVSMAHDHRDIGLVEGAVRDALRR